MEDHDASGGRALKLWRRTSGSVQGLPRRSRRASSLAEFWDRTAWTQRDLHRQRERTVRRINSSNDAEVEALVYRLHVRSRVRGGGLLNRRR